MPTMPGASAIAARRRLIRLALTAVLVVALVLLWRRAVALVPGFTGWVAGLGPWGVIAFIGGYALACVALVPASVLTLAAGAIFGVVKGVAIVFVGASLGACAAFLVGRYVARGMVERSIAGNPRFAAIDRAIGRQGRTIVLLLRLSPVFPFSLLNYALGLTRVRFTDYLLAMPGILPAALLYVYSGKLAGDLLVLAGGAAPARGPAYYALLGLGLAATVAVTVIVTRIARQALAVATAEPGATDRR
jgi:uncharacterized membrane protein YdjX (TVP38/TMEM64 family)